MATVVLTIHLILALGLIVSVLLQRSEGGGLGIGGGGGGGGVMTGRGAATALSKLTWGLGTAFVITSIALTVIGARNSATTSVVDTAIETSQETVADAPTPPPLGDDLLPVLPAEDGTLVPPPAE